MISASHHVWERRGSPIVAEAIHHEEEPCWVCAGPSVRGIAVDRWQGANFTGQNKVRHPDGRFVCESCVYVMAGKPPDTLRMTSHLLEIGGEYLTPNKGGKPAIRNFLRRPHSLPWIACVADTGQKHLIPSAKINPANARRAAVSLEERVVTIGDWSLVDRMTSLLTAGATKEELGRGEYGPRAWQLCGVLIRDFEAWHSGERSGGWFELALWLSQRDEVAVEARMAEEKSAKAGKKERDNAGRRREGAVAKPRRGIAARDEGGLPADDGRVDSAALGPVAGADAERREKKQQRRGMGDGHGAEPTTGGAQGDLFAGLAGPGGPSPGARKRRGVSRSD